MYETIAAERISAGNARRESGAWYTQSMQDNRAFFEEIYDSYAIDVKRFIFASARRDQAVTDDVFQNTWENAWRYLSSLKDRSKVKSWLFSIAHNEAKRYFAKKNIRFEFASLIGDSGADGPNEGYGIAEPEDPEATLFPDRVAGAALLTELLSKLSEEEQQLLILYYGYGMSLSELSELTGANYNTLKSITRRAIIKLKKLAQTDERIYVAEENEDE